MSEYREIITKAVVGKGRKYTKSTHTVSPKNVPTSVLGCWVINHEYKARKAGNAVEVYGTYDINLWYSYEDNTKTEVKTEKVTYKDEIKVRYRDSDFSNDKTEIIARVIQHPNCLEAVISPNGSKNIITVEREFMVEVVGETLICVQVNPDGINDEDWEYEIDDEELEELDPNFIISSEEE